MTVYEIHASGSDMSAPKVLALFCLRDGVVQSRGKGTLLESIKSDGIVGDGGEILRIGDGQRFLDALIHHFNGTTAFLKTREI